MAEKQISRRIEVQQALQTFLDEAGQQIDLLTLDGISVWMQMHPEEPIPRGLRTFWQARQLEQAISRTIKTAALVGIPLATERDMLLLRDRLLIFDDRIPDKNLVTWVRRCRAAPLAQFLAGVEYLHSQANIEGYQAITAEAKRVGWPTHYRDDLLVTDLEALCRPDAPREFWWGLRETGTDLYYPNTLESVRWALAAKQPGLGERRYYHYKARLQHISLDTMITQLVRTLDTAYHEQCWRAAESARWKAENGRHRDAEAMNAYREAFRESERAERNYQEVKRLKQQYQ